MPLIPTPSYSVLFAIIKMKTNLSLLLFPMPLLLQSFKSVCVSLLFLLLCLDEEIGVLVHLYVNTCKMSQCTNTQDQFLIRKHVLHTYMYCIMLLIMELHYCIYSTLLSLTKCQHAVKSITNTLMYSIVQHTNVWYLLVQHDIIHMLQCCLVRVRVKPHPKDVQHRPILLDDVPQCWTKILNKVKPDRTPGNTTQCSNKTNILHPCNNLLGDEWAFRKARNLF